MKEIEIEIEKETKKRHHPFRTLFFLIILTITLITIYGIFLGNKGLIIKEYELSNKNIPESLNNLKIAHFSDILYSRKDDMDYFEDIKTKINDKKVDIIIFTGNLTKNKYKFDEKETNKIIEYLSSLKATYGKYYVNGSNDKDDPSYDTIMINSGFTPLNDNKDIIYSKTKDKLLIVGLDNNSSKEFIKDIIADTTINYKIVAFSESDDIEEIKDYNFDLAIASNSLNGQINIPIIKDFFIRDGSEKYIEPYYKVNNTDFYISSGIGTDKSDLRIFNRPSINIYKLKKEEVNN